MNLNLLYNKLIGVRNEDSTLFLADKIEGDKNNIRLALDSNKNPILLIPEKEIKDAHYSYSNYKLNYLEIKSNQTCRISDFSSSEEELEMLFSTIKLVYGDFRMIDYFLRALEGLIIQLNKEFSYKTLKKEIEVLIGLFSKRKSVDFKIVIGLWGELFFINQSSNIIEVLNAWHDNENGLFDFSFKENKYVEVKTTLDPHRLHIFSNKQIENYKELDVKIVSIQTELSGSGKSIKDLWDSINCEIKDLVLKDKIQKIITKTLKSDIQALYEYKFDNGYAKSSLKYFNTKEIPSINEKFHHSIRKISLKIDLDLINS